METDYDRDTRIGGYSDILFYFSIIALVKIIKVSERSCGLLVAFYHLTNLCS